MPVQALWRLQGLVFAAQAGTAMGVDAQGAVQSSVTLMGGVAVGLCAACFLCGSELAR